jgi:hypothetical protein
MADDGPAKAFADARAQLRDTAKWMMNGTAAIVVLVIGSTSISGLGAMDWRDGRFVVAIIALAIGVAFCWDPFTRAVQVLKSEIVSLPSFVDTTDEQMIQARKAADKVLTGQIAQGSLTALQRHYEALRRTAGETEAQTREARRARDAARREVVAMGPILETGAQVCINELVGLRFERLVAGFAWPGSAILAAFFIFAWAANPGKEADKPLARPVAADLAPTAQGAAALAAAGLASGCFTPTAHVILLADQAGGRSAGLLVAREGGPACAPTRVSVIGGKVVG